MDKAIEQLILLILLLVFYCAGPFLALVAALTSIGVGGDIENELLQKVLTSLASDPGAYTGVLHQMIVPVIAAITAANYKNILANRLSAWLFVLPLLTIFVCIIDALIFNVVNLNGGVPGAAMETADGGIKAGGAISQFFLGMASTLSVYVMVLVGLKVNGDAREVQP